jgi:hypothetical protein
VRCAQVRVGPGPASAAWYCELDEDVLTVVRQDEYELALWVALLERAYVSFAERFGKDGLGADPSRIGYGAIDGGWEHEACRVFYGPDARRITTETTAGVLPGADVVAANLRAIWRLVQVTEGCASGDRLLLSVSTSDVVGVQRLEDQLAAIRADARLARRYPSFVEALSRLDDACRTYLGAAEAEQPELLLGLAARARDFVTPGTWPVLDDPGGDLVWQALADQLGLVASAGPAQEFGQRSVLSNHAYAVLGADFVDAKGAPLSLRSDPAALQRDAAFIDPEGSTVRLRNPHAANEPDLAHDPPDRDPEDGVFELSLGQYLRLFEGQEIARVADTA